MSNNKKLDILVLTPAIVGLNPGLTGGEMRFIELIKGWISQGHQIHILTSLGGKNLCENLGVSGCRYHIISESSRVTRIAFILRTLKIICGLPASVKNKSFDILYSPSEQFYDVLPAFRLKCKLGRNTRWATVVHWLPPYPPWKRQSSNILNSILFFISERMGLYLSLWKADILLPVSVSTEKQIHAVTNKRDKIKPVDCGVHLSQIRSIVSGVQEKKYDGIFMKRLQAVKGIFDLIDIWEMVVRNKADAQLAIIGSGIDGEKAKQIVQERNLDNNIKFLGVIYDMQDKFRYIAQSRLFVLPTYEENWAIVIGESMAAGVPVISYNLPELMELWQDKFISIPLGDKTKFSQMILELLSQPDKLEQYSQNGIAFIQKYDWNQIAHRELNYILDNHKEK